MASPKTESARQPPLQSSKTWGPEFSKYAATKNALRHPDRNDTIFHVFNEWNCVACSLSSGAHRLHSFHPKGLKLSSFRKRLFILYGTFVFSISTPSYATDPSHNSDGGVPEVKATATPSAEAPENAEKNAEADKEKEKDKKAYEEATKDFSKEILAALDALSFKDGTSLLDSNPKLAIALANATKELLADGKTKPEDAVKMIKDLKEFTLNIDAKSDLADFANLEKLREAAINSGILIGKIPKELSKDKVKGFADMVLDSIMYVDFGTKLPGDEPKGGKGDKGPVSVGENGAEPPKADPDPNKGPKSLWSTIKDTASSVGSYLSDVGNSFANTFGFGTKDGAGAGTSKGTGDSTPTGTGDSTPTGTEGRITHSLGARVESGASGADSAARQIAGIAQTILNPIGLGGVGATIDSGIASVSRWVSDALATTPSTGALTQGASRLPSQSNSSPGSPPEPVTPTSPGASRLSNTEPTNPQPSTPPANPQPATPPVAQAQPSPSTPASGPTASTNPPASSSTAGTPGSTTPSSVSNGSGTVHNTGGVTSESPVYTGASSGVSGSSFSGGGNGSLGGSSSSGTRFGSIGNGGGHLDNQSGASSGGVTANDDAPVDTLVGNPGKSKPKASGSFSASSSNAGLSLKPDGDPTSSSGSGSWVYGATGYPTATVTQANTLPPSNSEFGPNGLSLPNTFFKRNQPTVENPATVAAVGSLAGGTTALSLSNALSPAELAGGAYSPKNGTLGGTAGINSGNNGSSAQSTLANSVNTPSAPAGIGAGKAIQASRSDINVQVAGALPVNPGTPVYGSDNTEITRLIAQQEAAAGNIPSRSPETARAFASSPSSNGRPVSVNVADAGTSSGDEETFVSRQTANNAGETRSTESRGQERTTLWSSLTKGSQNTARAARGELVETLFRKAMNGAEAVNDSGSRAFSRSSAYRAPDMERVGSLLTKTLLGREEPKAVPALPVKPGTDRGKSDFGSWIGKKPMANLF